MVLRILFTTWAAISWASNETQHYPSGLLQNLAVTRWANSLSEPEAFRDFLSTNFGALGKQISFRVVSKFRGDDYTHTRAAIYYQGYRVVDHFVSTHFRRDGFIQYASSDLKDPIQLELKKGWDQAQSRLKNEYQKLAELRTGAKLSYIHLEPVVWIDGERRAHAAFELNENDFKPVRFRRSYLSAETGAVLVEFDPARYVSVSGKVYATNPTNASYASTTIPDLSATTTLTNAYTHVRRVESVTPKDVDPSQDFTLEVGFSLSPTSYDATCTGSAATSCPNQAFDAVNVYYHVNGYRQALNANLTTLGMTVAFPDEPLNVFINLGSGTSTNNAAYVNSSCNASGSIPRCLFFLAPATITSPTCGDAEVQFYDLAREANVAVHEYQHYVTDTITGLIPSTTTAPNVGDILHEGYSDYFGASYVSSTSGMLAATIGAYSFQQCTPIARDVSLLRILDNSSAEAGDSHLGGHTFATGLWQLREDFVDEFGTTDGPAKMDKLALRSLFFLSANPGFVDAIESLVRADETLYSGNHVGRIRTIFYDDLHFIGGQTGVFKDSASKIAEVGFKSCASVGNVMASGSWTIWMMLVWLAMVLGSGRAWAEKENATRQLTNGRRVKVIKRYAASDPEPSVVGVTLGGGFDGLIASVPAGGNSSKGHGMNASLELRYRLEPNLYLRGGLSYHQLALGRTLDGSGAMLDPNPINFSQEWKYLGVVVGSGYRVFGRDLLEPVVFSPQVWVDGSLQYLSPLSGNQTDGLGGSQALTTGDKLVFFSVGGRCDLFLARSWDLVVATHLFYNLTSSGSKLFGVRGTLAVQVNL